MKKIFATAFITLLILASGLVFYCVVNTNRLFLSISGNEKFDFNKHFDRLSCCYRFFDYCDSLPKYLDKTYLILLQNNFEIRSTGGFMGSYAIVKFENGVLKEWGINDIYTPDGQIEGHVESKTPLQQAFKSGTWRLPNSNWETDFQKAAPDIVWFFNKAGITDIDGVVALNFEFIKRWIGVLNEIELQDFSEKVSEDNFYYLAQSHAEEDFFPGSYAKKNYLSSVGISLYSATMSSSYFEKLKLLNLILNQLEEGQIIVWMEDDNMADEIKKLGWDGGLGDYGFDYFYSVESNLGANKSNYCIERDINQDITIGVEVLNKTVITFTNYTDMCKSNNVQNWIGKYINFQRILIPKASEIKKIKVNGVEYNLNNEIDSNNPPDFFKDVSYSTKTYDKFIEIGFWVIVLENSSAKVELDYSLPVADENLYSMFINRQPGIYQIPYKLTVNGELITDTILINDELFEVEI